MGEHGTFKTQERWSTGPRSREKHGDREEQGQAGCGCWDFALNLQWGLGEGMLSRGVRSHDLGCTANMFRKESLMTCTF